MDKCLQRIDDPGQQERETFLYWQNLPVGDRLSAVWDASAAAFSFAAAFHGGPRNDARRLERTLTRVERDQDRLDVKKLRASDPRPNPGTK